ncbi:MAG: PDZ domain-containing protein [Clostridiales bacterium]|nr:PDZ domain-containing protein [Clostridiales bacterium]
MQKKDEKVARKPIRKRILYSLLLAFIIAVSFTGGYFSHYAFQTKQISNTLDIIKIIENFGYILDENGNVKDFTESDYAFALVNGLLDEYSYYYTKEEYDQKQKDRVGDTSGYGVTIYNDESYKPIIVSVIGNSPADHVGLKSGDLVLTITKNGQETVVENSKQLAQLIEGDTVGTQIFMTVSRNGQQINTPFTLVKSDYQKNYVEYYDSERKMALWTSDGKDGFEYSERSDQKLEYLDKDVALIKLSSFEGKASEQLQSTLEYMKSQNRTKLILDLRNNGGGYMDVLEEVASSLIYNGGKKTLIAHAKNKTSTEDFYMEKSKNNSFINGISVLANENTASASECLIGAMLYYKENFDLSRLVIEKNKDGVAKTYGKGIMQTTYLMADGGAFKLTTATIYQPDKTTTIHGKGFVVSGDNATVAGDSAIFRALETLS